MEYKRDWRGADQQDAGKENYTSNEGMKEGPLKEGSICQDYHFLYSLQWSGPVFHLPTLLTASWPCKGLPSKPAP
jgi:hypothetical protein